jgi:hypothetical protein
MSEPMNDMREEVELEDRCEYCGTADTDHKHGNGHRCCGNCCATHGSLTRNKEAYTLVSQIVSYKNELMESLKASLAANREKDAEIARLKDQAIGAVTDKNIVLEDNMRLRSELSSLRASAGEKWIEIKEGCELPPERDDNNDVTVVLVYSPKYPTQHLGRYRSYNRTWTFIGSNSDWTKEITHWMPMVAPPSTEKES